MLLRHGGFGKLGSRDVQGLWALGCEMMLAAGGRGFFDGFRGGKALKKL